MRIPEFIEHIDCPKCVRSQFTTIALHSKPTRANCQRCSGEGVIRADGKPTLKTKLGDGYAAPAIRLR